MYEQLNPSFSAFGGVCSRLLLLGWRSTLNVPIWVWNLAVPRCSLTPARPGVLLPGFNYTKIDGIHYLRCHCNITYLRWNWSPYLWRWTALKYLSCLLKVICWPHLWRGICLGFASSALNCDCGYFALVHRFHFEGWFYYLSCLWNCSATMKLC